MIRLLSRRRAMLEIPWSTLLLVGLATGLAGTFIAVANISLRQVLFSLAGIVVFAVLLRFCWLVPVLLSMTLIYDRLFSLAGAVSLSDLILIMGALILPTRLPQAVRSWHNIRIPLTLLFSFYLLTSMTTLLSGEAANLSLIRTMGAQMAIVLIIPALITSVDEIKTTHAGYILGGLVAVALGYYQLYHFYAFGELVFPVDRSWLYIPFLDRYILRVTSVLENPVHFGFYLLFPTMLATIYLLKGGTRRRTKIWMTMALPILLSGIILAVARGALLGYTIGMGLGVILLSWERWRDINVVILLAVALFLVGLVAVWMGLPQAILALNTESLISRVEILSRTVRLWQLHPITGHGWGTDVIRINNLSLPPHSAVVQALLDGGIAGFVTFCSAIIWILFNLGRRLKNSYRDVGQHAPVWLAATVISIFTVSIQTFFFDPTLFMKSLWVPIALALTIINLHPLPPRNAITSSRLST